MAAEWQWNLAAQGDCDILMLSKFIIDIVMHLLYTRITHEGRVIRDTYSAV